MRGFGAKDADRDRCVELIEAAHADGQIGAADRELRVGRARSAETLDELETLTRDLRMPAGHVAPVATAPGGGPAAGSSAWRPAGGRRPPVRPRRAAGILVLLGVVVAVVAVGLVSLVLFVSSAPDTPSARTTQVGVDPGSGTETSTSQRTPSFAMTPPEVRAFVRAYERKFGTLESFEVGFYPQRVGVQVPVRGSRPRMERWSWDGAWHQDTEAAAVVGPNQRVDLGTVDVRRFFANIDVARRTLDVEKGQFTHALLIRWGDEATELNIYVGNRFNESGYLSSTPAGEITRRIPYAP